MFVRLIILSFLVFLTSGHGNSIVVMVKSKNTPVSEIGKVVEYKKFFSGSRIDSNMEKGSALLVEYLTLALKNSTVVDLVPYANLSQLLTEMKAGKGDVAVFLVLAKPERFQSHKFLWKIGTIRSTLVLRKSSAVGIGDIFLSKSTSSLLVLFSCLFMSVIMALSMWSWTAWPQVWFWTVSIVAQQESPDNMSNHKLGSRLIMISSAAGMLLLNVYTASLASSIATPVSMISNSKDLMEQHFQYVYNEWKSTKSVHKYFMQSDPYFAEILKTSGIMTEDTDLYSLISKVLQQNGKNEKLFTSVTTSMLSRFMDQNDIPTSDVLILPANDPIASSQILALPFGNNSKNAKLITAGLTKIKEFGLMNLVEAAWMGPKIARSYNESPSFKPAVLVQIKSAFFIWLGGTSLALLIFLFECLLHRKFSPETSTKTLSIEEAGELVAFSKVNCCHDSRRLTYYNRSTQTGF